MQAPRHHGLRPVAHAHTPSRTVCLLPSRRAQVAARLAAASRAYAYAYAHAARGGGVPVVAALPGKVVGHQRAGKTNTCERWGRWGGVRTHLRGMCVRAAEAPGRPGQAGAKLQTCASRGGWTPQRRQPARVLPPRPRPPPSCAGGPGCGPQGGGTLPFFHPRGGQSLHSRSHLLVRGKNRVTRHQARTVPWSWSWAKAGQTRAPGTASSARSRPC